MALRILPLIALALAGCAPAAEVYRWKSGGTLALLKDDLTNCELAALREVPVNTQTEIIEGISEPIRTICKPGEAEGETICTTRGGEVFPPQVRTFDANLSLRRDVAERCLATKGYRSTTLPGCESKVIPSDLSAIAARGSRAPKDGSCAVTLRDGSILVLYPEEFAG